MNAQRVLTVLSGLALAMGMIPRAQAITGCNNAMLMGAYGFHFSGSLTPDLSGGVGGAVTPTSVMSQLAAGATPAGVSTKSAGGVARLYLDGAGTLFGNSAASVDGAWSEGPLTGTYSINDDCSASFTLTDSSGGTQHFDAVVLNQGDSASLLQTDKGVGVSGSLRRARGSCQTSDLIGTYGIRNNGSLRDSGAFTSIGKISVDDQGNVTATESRFSGGAYSQVTSTGTIAVNLDCTLTLSLASTVDGSLANFRGMMTSARELMLVQSDDGASVTGNVTAQ